jgi:hypothetical protein
VLARHGGSEVLDEYRLMMLGDYFVPEHRLRGGRTIVEQFVDAHAELSRQEREMLLGWRDVVQGPWPGGPARRGPEITSPLLASPGTVASMFSPREPMRPAPVPTLRVGFVNGMPYQ